MFRKKKPTFIIAFDATTQAMATDKFCTKNAVSYTHLFLGLLYHFFYEFFYDFYDKEELHFLSVLHSSLLFDCNQKVES